MITCDICGARLKFPVPLGDRDDPGVEICPCIPCGGDFCAACFDGHECVPENVISAYFGVTLNPEGAE